MATACSCADPPIAIQRLTSWLFRQRRFTRTNPDRFTVGPAQLSSAGSTRALLREGCVPRDESPKLVFNHFPPHGANGPLYRANAVRRQVRAHHNCHGWMVSVIDTLSTKAV